MGEYVQKGRCNKCVLPNNNESVSDPNSVCELCSNPNLLSHIAVKPDESHLLQIISEIKSGFMNKEYDCLLAWSGGRDSTFMLYELVSKFKLNCAAVFGITPFTPVEIIENVRNISKTLNVKLIEINTPANHSKIAGFCLKLYEKHKLPILINLACSSCKFVNRAIFKTAAKLNIKTVIYCGNRFEYFSGPASIDINTSDRFSIKTMLLDLFLRIKKGVKLIADCPALIKYLPTFFSASVLYINQYSVYLKLRYPGIYRFDYFHYADWDEAKVESALRELQWKLPAGCNSTWRADCVFEAVKNKAFKEQLGITYSEALYSNLIRAGKMTREDAIARLEKEGISEQRYKEAMRVCEGK